MSRVMADDPRQVMPVGRSRDKVSGPVAVLIMDDSAEFAEFVQEVVELCGHVATTVTQPSHFKGICVALKPRVVILDIHMPDLDGMHLTQWLGEFAEAYDLDVRLIIVSGRGEDVIQLCKSVAAMSGFSDVQAYNKPVEVATLVKALSGIEVP